MGKTSVLEFEVAQLESSSAGSIPRAMYDHRELPSILYFIRRRFPLESTFNFQEQLTVPVG